MTTTSLMSPLTAALIVENAQPLEFGGRLDRYAIGFRLHGDPDLPLVVALGGISAGRCVASCPGDPRRGWWEDLVGDGLAIDTTKYSVLGIDWLGGSGASSGPGHRLDESDEAFPAIGTRDQARAIVAVLDHLGVHQARAIVGASYGGMVALACGADFPDRFAHAVVVSAAHGTHPMATALRSLQREVVRLGIAGGHIADGLRIARGIAMTTYRTTTEFVDRFESAPRWSGDGARFPVEDYLDHAGRRFAATFSAESFLRLSESIDLHSVEPGAVQIPVTLVAVCGDTLVPVWQMEQLRDGLHVEARWHVVESIYGHDAFLKEIAAMSRIIGESLE
jgi:homoserine O-acetyltransferase